MLGGVFVTWPEEFARQWRQAVGPVPWHLGLLIRESLRSGDFFPAVLGPLFLAAKLVHVVASVQYPCWSMSATGTFASWLSGCTTSSLLAEHCGFTCVGDNCAISYSHLKGYPETASNCTWLYDWEFQRCTSLAAPGFGLDSSTGTCAWNHSELTFPNAWALFPSWLAAILARTVYCTIYNR